MKMVHGVPERSAEFAGWFFRGLPTARPFLPAFGPFFDPLGIQWAFWKVGRVVVKLR
jgi:hypothetical protein